MSQRLPEHPYLSVPGSLCARAHECICAEQRPPRYHNGRPVWDIDPLCPTHNLAAALRYLDDAEQAEALA